MLISAEVPNPIPAGYAVYQLDAVQYGADSFAGWKMVKQKNVPAVDDKGQPIKGPDSKQLQSQVDDPDAEVTYDPHTQVLKQLDQSVQVAAKIGGAQAQLKVTVDEANKAMAKIGGQLAQLQAAAKSTDATN